MYTQCPECGVAFRVTAEVLKQAAGKVRCGGCGVAFNALNHLSEQKPAAPVQPEPPPDPHVPELKPEEPGELEADTPPQSISAEQSAALLKTLDQLAGSDIRIEDTGVEWRVVDEDNVETSDEAETSDDTPEQPDLIADTGSLRFVVEGEEDISVDEPLEVVEEMRFDDNTPLPDDFDFSSEPATQPEPRIEAPAPKPEPEAEPEDAQVDLALGDPEEWEDLLGDLDEPAVPDVEEEPEPETDEEPDEVQEDLIMLADTQAEDSADQPPDMDTQFAIQAEAMGIDLSGVHETVQDEAELETREESEIDDEHETSIEEDLIAAAFEAEAAATAQEGATSAAEPLDEEDEEAAEFEEESVELEEEGEEAAELEEEEEEEIELDLDIYLEAEDDEPEDDVEDIALPFDDKVEEVIETIAASLDDDEPEDRDEVADDASDAHPIPEMSEEEKTINMMIDQELFNIAVEDEDGFASTIVQIQPDKKVEKELDDNKKEEKEEEKAESPPLVETIIMEGEFIRGDLDKERLAADKTVKSRNLDDPGVSIPLKKTMYGAIRHTSPPGAGMIAAAVALVLLLVLQVMHQSREALATVPVFNSAVGPIYRMLGQPLTPTWDVSGWRIEATKGSTEVVGRPDDAAESEAPVQTDEILTIYSRIGNRSEMALPYPLVHVSLTDRFEEIIGSRVLEPAEYLAENADPRKPVAPGNTFNAVISIESADDVATGFRLDVCYRLASGQLRCAIEDFK